MSNFGKKVWYIPDGYYPDNEDEGKYKSHEAICVLNTSNKDAEILITLFFENMTPMEGFLTKCPANRTNHIRMDKIKNSEGKNVPKGVAYAIMIQSNTRIICQYSRVDTAQNNMSFMTTIAY